MHVLAARPSFYISFYLFLSFSKNINILLCSFLQLRQGRILINIYESITDHKDNIVIKTDGMSELD
jgi:hypothetical protein